jgi:CRISPR system Cascade subunit CasA
MQFNLIDEQWIPVRRRDGTKTMIAPYEVTDQFKENPVMSLDAPRSDFNGALIQFLIGLVQTVAAPQNGAEWRKKLIEPPAPEELNAAFSSVHHAFEFGGDGPRFMQDYDALTVSQGNIDGILIDMPGDSTTKKNTDHFIKRNTVKKICPSCSAIALLTMQINAPAGGQGNRTSLRGGGPLTTIIAGDKQHDTLWQLIWLNVLEHGAFLNICCNPKLITDDAKFPWMTKTRTSETEGNVCQPGDFHPAVMFWGMPRRIRLNTDYLMNGYCDTCGQLSDSLISQYQQKNFGMNFTGSWLHPLSPYSIGNDELIPTHPQPGGVTYRHWLGLVQQDNNDKKMPARIVHEFINNRHRAGWQFRLWAFGYDMKNMNARCWYESRMPLLYIDPSIRTEYENTVASVIKSAVIVGKNLRIALKNAIHGKPIVDPITNKIKWEYKDIKKLPADEDKRRSKVLFETKENTSLISIESLFWQNTEALFYALLADITKTYENKMEMIAYLMNWHNCLCLEAERLFDAYSWELPIEDSNPKRIVIARNEMRKFNRGSKVKNLLNL